MPIKGLKNAKDHSKVVSSFLSNEIIIKKTFFAWRDFLGKNFGCSVSLMDIEIYNKDFFC